MNRCSFPREPVTACGIELLTVWQVAADANYEIRAERSRMDSHVRNNKAGREMVAVRTVRGAGRLHCSDREYNLSPGSLLLFDFPSLERYATQTAPWAFWWFEFRLTEPFRLPAHQVMNAPYSAQEEAACGDIFRLLRSEEIAIRCRAAALLQSLLFEWWAAAALPHDDNDRHRHKVQQLIEAIHRNPEKPWTLQEMASRAGMSISSLRAAFHHTTGKPPAQLRNEMRVAHAYELLKRGDQTVAEVAAQLGYCDLFHFSKVFKTVYGFSPSTILRRIR